MQQQFDEYNFKSKFNEECGEALTKIRAFCATYHIPFFITFALMNDNKKTDYLTAKLLPPETSVNLKDDLFRKIVLAMNGFDIAINHDDIFDLKTVGIKEEKKEEEKKYEKNISEDEDF